MGNLPSDRTKMGNKPLLNIRFDYSGPITVMLPKRKAKRWGVMFSCLNTRAVHLELAGDLTTDSFLLSLRQFISRRGELRIIRSDNDTNFVGAAVEIMY